MIIELMPNKAAKYLIVDQIIASFNDHEKNRF